MPPSLADLLCWEDFSGCFSENENEGKEDGDGGEERGRKKKKGRYTSPAASSSSSSSSISWMIPMAMVQPQEEEEEDDDDEEEEEEDCFDSEATFSALVEREVFHMPSSDYLQKYEKKLLDSQSRQNAISWLFKVWDFYNFSPLTAALSINYLDRFLSLRQIQDCKGWMMQLLSVACLSLAVKMEETEVPLLLDLQVRPDCIFEPQTIQRMELLVLSTLEWRLSSVTPFSYVDFFVRHLDLGGTHCVPRIDELILCAFQEIQFLYYPPSSIAVAAVLCATQEMCPLQFTKTKKILFSMLPQHLHDSIESCIMLMTELLCNVYVN